MASNTMPAQLQLQKPASLAVLSALASRQIATLVLSSSAASRRQPRQGCGCTDSCVMPLPSRSVTDDFCRLWSHFVFKIFSFIGCGWHKTSRPTCQAIPSSGERQVAAMPKTGKCKSSISITYVWCSRLLEPNIQASSGPMAAADCNELHCAQLIESLHSCLKTLPLSSCTNEHDSCSPYLV